MAVTLRSVKFGDIEGLIRNCDYPAMLQNPLRLIMFLNSNSETKEEEIEWQITSFQKDFEDMQSAFFRQACLEDGTQVGFAMWTLDRCQLPANGEEKEMTVRPLAKPNLIPRSLDIENWRRVSKMLRAEKERVLGDRKNICRLNTLSVSPAYQSRGYGSMLLRWGCELADERGLVSFVMASPVGVNLYQKFGYEAVGLVKTEHGKFTSMLREPHST